MNRCLWCGIPIVNLEVCWYCSEYEQLLQEWYEGRTLSVLPAT